MANSRSLAYDFMGQTSPKRAYPEKPKFKVIKSAKVATKLNVKKNRNVSMILSSCAMFGMLLLVIYRSNIISEKNLEVQRLNMALDNAKAAYATSEISLIKNNDMSYIEAYAKQQLGMQKPEKNQIIYINADYKTEVSKAKNTSLVKNLIDKIKSVIEKII